jgi:hypothetical protein
MPPTLVNYVDRSDIEPIKEYLEAYNLGVNKYRVKVGEGVSQCLGIVSKRSQTPDLSRQSWLHPKLHHMLMGFGEKYVRQHIDWTSIQVNCNYVCAPHKDTGNTGDSYIVAFGNFVGGEICIEDAPYNIFLRGLIFDGSQHLHWTKDWQGVRYSVVYHTLKPRFPMIKQLSDYTAVQIDNIWKIRYLNDDGDPQYLWKNNGLPHPLKGRIKIE